MPGTPDLAAAQPPPSISRAPRRSPSPRLWQMRLTEVLVATGLIAILGGTAAGLSGGWAATGAILAVAGCGGALALWIARRRYRTWAYTERDDDLIVERGVMFRRLSVVPYGRMQFVDVTAGPIERAFRIATVRLHTAAAATDARIPGLEAAEAARLRDRLAALGEARAAGL